MTPENVILAQQLVEENVHKLHTVGDYQANDETYEAMFSIYGFNKFDCDFLENELMKVKDLNTRFHSTEFEHMMLVDYSNSVELGGFSDAYSEAFY
jgi:hypothetical protein